MLAFLAALIVVCGGMAVVGWYVGGLFALTLVGSAGLLLLGGIAVTRILRRAAVQQPAPARPDATVRPLRTTGSTRARAAAPRGHGTARAA